MSDKQLFDEVRQLYLSNVNEGYSKSLHEHFCYVKPSPGTYPFQYFWDTCMQVHVLAALKEYDLAKKNMISLFGMQAEDGFVGHMIFWNRSLPLNKMNIFQSRPTLKQLRPHMSALIQPPLAAQAVWRIYEDTHDADFVKLMLPKLKKQHAWLVAHRDFEGSNLLSMITTFESGMDWKPSYDVVLGFPHGLGNKELYKKVVWGIDARNFLAGYDLAKIYKQDRFIVKDAGFNAIYVRDLHAMADLCQAISDPEADWYKEKAGKVAQSIMEHMYDEQDQAFYDVYGYEMKKSRVLTPTIFFPAMLDEMPHHICKAVIERHLFNEGEFTAAFPIPSVAKSDPSFYPYQTDFLWRGPTWVVYTWFLFQSLLQRGYIDEADKTLDATKALIAKSGFREYYNPFSGVGYGAKSFTWSGLVIDMIRIRRQFDAKKRSHN